jgi:protein TonB
MLVWFMALVFFGCTPQPLDAASGDAAVRVRLYEGFRGGAPDPGGVTSSYYLKPLEGKDVTSGASVEREKGALKRVFSLTGVKFVTEATMVLRKGRDSSPFQVIIMNGRKMLVQLSLAHHAKDKFRVEVFKDEKPPRSLFRGTIFLPRAKSTALGFEDSEGKIYFLSFHRHENPAPGPYKTTEKISHTKQPQRLKKARHIKKPMLLRKADPIYPDTAKKAKVSGKVVVEGTTNLAGDVVKAEAVEGPGLLKQAAVDAVKQWKYSPYIVDGVKEPVSFTVVLNFRLEDDGQAQKPLQLSSKEAPKVIKKVEPKYPKEAIKKGLGGKVVLEPVVDETGNVISVDVVDGIPGLNEAAAAALKQWKFKPFILNGRAKKVRFTVVVQFKLK